MNLLALRAQEKQLELVAILEPDVPVRVNGDALRLRQILLNLGGNAVKFTATGEVVLRVQVARSTAAQVTLHFAIRDTGIGIAADKVQGLFTPFSQVDSSNTRRFGGTGLGLAISRQLVGYMGGEIGVQSQPDAGSVFWFTANFGLPEATATIDAHTLDGLRVLVTDPSASSREMLVKQLTAWGCVCSEAADFATFMARIHPPLPQTPDCDVALIDVNLVESDGGRWLQQGQATTPIILMTSLAALTASSAVRQAGATIYLAKPIQRAELHTILVNVAERRPAANRAAPSQPASPPPAEVSVARVLLAEDNRVNQMVAVAVLKKLGYQVDVAANGLEALAALRARPYDLVLMQGLPSSAAPARLRWVA